MTLEKLSETKIVELADKLVDLVVSFLSICSLYNLDVCEIRKSAQLRILDGEIDRIKYRCDVCLHNENLKKGNANGEIKTDLN